MHIIICIPTIPNILRMLAETHDLFVLPNSQTNIWQICLYQILQVIILSFIIILHIISSIILKKIYFLNIHRIALYFSFHRVKIFIATVNVDLLLIEVMNHYCKIITYVLRIHNYSWNMNFRGSGEPLNSIINELNFF